MKNLIAGLCFLVVNTLIGQSGIIKGNVIDGKSKEPLIGAVVMIKGTENAAFTDVFGNFMLTVEAGRHTLEVMMQPQYANKIVDNVVVLAGGEKDLGVISMAAGVTELIETVIRVEKSTKSEGGALQAKKEKTEVAEVMSKAEITKKGAGDAADAVKSAPGVSVIGGKYVYVRGLGDRYNKTTLNGLDVPGLDPDRNAVQMDLFPTNLIGGVAVSKSFVAQLPADFTGGIVDISLREFPSKRGGNVSFSVGFNPNMHFNNDYYTYDRVGGEIIGLGAGARALPEYSIAADNPTLMGQFNPVLAPYQTASFMDYSLGGDYGDKRILKSGATIGYNVALSYSEKTRFYEDVKQERYALATDPSDYNLIPRALQVGDYGTNDVLISSLAGVAYKKDNSSYKFNALRIQNGESKAGFFEFSAPTNNPYDALQYNLEYNQRVLTNFSLAGKHSFSDTSKWVMEWKGSATFSSMDDPDIRRTRYNLSNPNRYGTEAGTPQRIWRDMFQSNYAGKLDFIKKYKWLKRDAKLRFGAGAVLKNRDYAISIYELSVTNFSDLGMGDDPNEVYLSQNVFGSPDAPNDAGFQVNPPSSFSSTDPNRFTSGSRNISGYLSTEVFLLKKLQAVAGLRVEQFNLQYTGFRSSDNTFLNKEEFLNNLDLFPTLGLTYNVNKNQKIRFAGTKTVARPSFKEMSFATIIDPLSGITFLGGLNPFNDPFNDWDGDLTKTDIYNADLRWELFMKRAQTVSVSTFYKHFFNPIEMIQIPGAPGNFQPRNVGSAQVFGFEFESKKRLDFLTKKFKNLAASFNYTYTISRVEMSDVVRENKTLNARDDEEVGKFRDMAGQSPYLINAGLSYEGGSDSTAKATKGLSIGLYYNVQGQTLQYVGITENPDVYLKPFHSLNVTASKQFGKADKYKLSFKAENVLGDVREEVFVSFGSEERLFSSLAPMRIFKLGFSMKF